MMNMSENVTADSTMGLAAIVAVSVVAGLCSLLTVFGNFFVILAFITNRSLRNFSNYLILNLAISDLIIGLFSMNIHVVYNIRGTWTMGRGMCNAWLTVDYVVSNTSVMNLLVICIDRYVAVTSPVMYRRRCTANMAALVICIAWTFSFLLWAPAILLWEFISQGINAIDEGGCSIPFMDSSPAVTIITAVGAFYLPVAAMCALYWRVIVKIEKQTSSVSSIISRATTAMSTRYTSPFSPNKVEVRVEEDHSDRIDKDGGAKQDETKKASVFNKNHTNGEKCESGTNEGYPVSIIDGNKFADLLRQASNRYGQNADLQTGKRDSGSDKNSTTHLLKREDTKSSSGPEISETPHSVTKSEESLKKMENNQNIVSPTISIKRSAATRSKKVVTMRKCSSTLSFLQKNNENRLNREKRATNLLKSILICFICLWLPYNVIVIVNGICGTNCTISNNLWILSYWLCYLNSTANPFCYGYCNENFQRTFRALLTTKWWTQTGRRKMRCQVGRRGSLRAV